ncbi:UNKNOWN [Stylonychia lemnae]|uniref:Uncharacterized protein n=1 Tax=Stylonychia lemnae TaxID=5949 RepID=A0A078B7R5_STYLE|nr:UNKNOWN [Stylonychia lemnae]|eukprot:CDW90555.1 UNKNOWN [Stylonychia lemnae]
MFCSPNKLIVLLLGIIGISMVFAIQMPNKELAETQSEVSSLQNLSANDLNNLYLQWQARILTYIRNNGLYLGSRWVIRQENPSQALVFRDLQSGGDYRYAMFTKKYVDL